MNIENIKNQIKELKKTLQTDWKYQRKPCVKCKYKIICAGECDKTLK